MKLISIFLTSLVAFGGHPCHLLCLYAQQHDLHTTAIISRNNGISSPTNNNIRNVNVHNEGVVAIAHQDEEARNLKVHEVFAKMKDTLEKKGVMMDGRSSRHLSSNLPHDELVSVFKASLLLIEIIYSDVNAQDKLSASALVSVGILGLLEIINEDQAIAFLNNFESKVVDEMDDGRKLMNSAEYDGGRHLQTLQEELPVFPITDPDSFFAAIVNVALLIIRNFTDEGIVEQITLLAFTTRVIDLVSSSIFGIQPTFTCPDTSIGAGSMLEGGNCCVQADCSVGSCIANTSPGFSCATDDEAINLLSNICANCFATCGGPDFSEDCGNSSDNPRPTCQQVFAEKCCNEVSNVGSITPGICVVV